MLPPMRTTMMLTVMMMVIVVVVVTTVIVVMLVVMMVKITPCALEWQSRVLKPPLFTATTTMTSTTATTMRTRITKLLVGNHYSSLKILPPTTGTRDQKLWNPSIHFVSILYCRPFLHTCISVLNLFGFFFNASLFFIFRLSVFLFFFFPKNFALQWLAFLFFLLKFCISVSHSTAPRSIRVEKPSSGQDKNTKELVRPTW